MGDIFGSMLDYNPITGRKKTRRQIKREIISENRRKGSAGENLVRTQFALQGYETERTGRGSDFRVRKRDIMTGRVIESKLIEVKTGRAKLSKLQNKTKKKKSNYRVIRADLPFY